MQLGGQLSITTDVENYPGFAKAVKGPDLMEQMRLQAENVGTTLVQDTIVSVDLRKQPFQVEADSGIRYGCDALIIATGAQARWLGLESEAHYRGFGVSACATCDGFFYRKKSVVVVGGGNSAMEEALYLTNHASSVTLVHRSSTFKAEAILLARVMENPKVTVLRDHVVEAILGQDEPFRSVVGVQIRDLNSGLQRRLSTDGVFVAIGHEPASSLFSGQLDMDERGYIKVEPWSTKTSVSGVYSCGDVSDPVYRQAVTAAGMGCMAALEAQRFLSGQSGR
jgi:thioredoxin reductase (NADPH)